ncbi:hypothetical protein ACH4M4_32155 [Streptomyces sp. NPDC017254]|uniref:hypothetical protein n=1 Tax=unclassified Streptomyces TaxID=2593676 RepID=UPI0037A01ACF
MSSRPSPQTPSPSAEWVNERIRHLMGQPDSDRRAVEYRRLLDLWVRANAVEEFVTAA